MSAPLARAMGALRARVQGWHGPLADALALERQPHDEIVRRAHARLARLVRHAATRVPLWRERFAAAGIDPAGVRSLADLAALPPLTKEDLRERAADLVTDGRVDPAWIRNASGGSTGAPVTFYQDRDYQRRMLADQARHLTWTGLPWWTPRAYVWGADRDSRAHDGMSGRVKDGLAGVLFLNTFRATDADYRAFARRCAHANVPLIIGYASSLDHFARVVEDECRSGRLRVGAGPGAWRPRAVQSSAERLEETVRSRIEGAFGCGVFDRYGSREMGNAAHECTAHAGLHVSMERVAVEVVRDGRAAPAGEEGELLVTVLDNLAMPLLRYRVGDVGRVLNGGPCPCGRAYDRLQITAGRTSDLFTSPAGRRVHGEYFTHLFYGLEAVRGFRIVQETRERLVLEVVPGPGYAPQVLDPVLAGIREIDPGFRPEVRVVDEIPVLDSGKRRFTLSRVPVEW